jgi:hypothetical protein
LLGAFLPNTLAGTIVGKLMAIPVPTAVLIVFPRKSRRVMFDGVSSFFGRFFFSFIFGNLIVL